MDDQLENGMVEKEIYCEMFEVDPDGVNDSLIHSFFEQHAAEHLELLKAGYQQMAEINTEITEDFTLCEADCEKHLYEVLDNSLLGKVD